MCLFTEHKKAPHCCREGLDKGKQVAENGGDFGTHGQTNNAQKITACQAAQRAPFQGNASPGPVSLRSEHGRCNGTGGKCSQGKGAILKTNFMGYQPGDEPQTVVRTFRELSKIEFPDRPLIRGLLDEYEMLLLYGGSNLGKSILSLITAIHLANGHGRLFGTWEIERAHRVLFVQAENSSKSIQRRMQTMLSARPEWAEAAFDNIAELTVPDRGEQPRGKVTHRDFQAGH